MHIWVLHDMRMHQCVSGHISFDVRSLLESFWPFTISKNYLASKPNLLNFRSVKLEFADMHGLSRQHLPQESRLRSKQDFSKNISKFLAKIFRAINMSLAKNLTRFLPRSQQDLAETLKSLWPNTWPESQPDFKKACRDLTEICSDLSQDFPI